MLASIERIERYTDALSFADFAANDQVVDAVVHNLVVIGEAARYVPESAEQLAPAVPWGDMRSMRNFVVHVYHAIRLETIWETVQEDLPPLREQLRVLLADG